MDGEHKNVIDKLMNKPMSRKDFLAHVGVAMVGLIGVSAAIKNLSELSKKPTGKAVPDSKVKRGFGGGSYGA